MPNIKGRRGRSWVAAATLLQVAALSACGAGPGDPADDRPLVLTTFTVLADVARNVAGEHLRVESVTEPGTEIHGYEPTPGDVRRGAGADLVLAHGMGLEAWLSQLLDRVDAPRVTVSEGIEPIPVAGQTDVANPHTWMSPLAVRTYVDVMVEEFSALAPEHAGAFARNGAAYRVELEAVHDELVADLAALPRDRRALVTCEGAFSYLARDAGLREQYVWPVNAEQQATPQRVARTIAFVEDNDVPAVFCESTVSDRAMRQVAQATGARFGGVLHVDSLSGPDGPVPTYLDLVRHDVETIVDGLTSDAP